MALTSMLGVFGSNASGLCWYNYRTDSGAWWNYLYADFISGCNLCKTDDSKERKIKYVSLKINDGCYSASGNSAKATSKNKDKWIKREISCGNDWRNGTKFYVTWKV